MAGRLNVKWSTPTVLGKKKALKNQNKTPTHGNTSKMCRDGGGILIENKMMLCQMSCHGFTIFPQRETEFSLLWNLRCKPCCSWEKSYVRIEQCFQIWLVWADKQWMSTQHSRKSLSAVKSLSEGAYILFLVVLHIMNSHLGACLCTTHPIKFQQEFLGSQLWAAKAPAVPETILQHYLLSSKLYITFSQDSVMHKKLAKLIFLFT